MFLLDKLNQVMFVQEVDNSSERSDALKVRQAGSSAKRDPLKALAKKVGLVLSGDGRTFLEPETDLAVIERAYNAEAYVRQGVDKYIDKMFKAGWKFVGKNPATVEYIRLRFAYMAEATGIPTEKLFVEYCEDIVKFSNAIIAKSRMSDQSQLPPSVSVQGYANRQPVVGYFPLNVTTMTVNRDKLGVVKQWQQEVEGGDKPIKYKPEDIIHTYYKRSKGNAFGTPFITPVLDDIRALREAEDNVLKMLYRNIHPFYHIAIGSEDAPADDPEIDAAKTEIEGMSVDGGLVTSERWKISSVAADKIVEAQPYLKYFEERVFSGLGVSATMFGRGDTANKSTSDNQSAEFVDRVKAFQAVGAADIDAFMISELLYEGGFDPILNPDDMVHFVFNEIDIDMQVKLENHAIFKYEHNSITEDEMRQLLGLDVITDRSKMFNELITIYTAEQTAKASAQFKPTGENGTPSTNNKIKPKNQHNPQGKETKGKPKKTNNSMDVQASMTNHLDELGEQLVRCCSDYYDGKEKALSEIIVLISVKESILIDILKENDYVDNVISRVQRAFGHLRSGVVDAFKGMKYNGSITKEASAETINSVIKVTQCMATQILDKEV